MSEMTRAKGRKQAKLTGAEKLMREAEEQGLRSAIWIVRNAMADVAAQGYDELVERELRHMGIPTSQGNIAAAQAELTRQVWQWQAYERSKGEDGTFTDFFVFKGTRMAKQRVVRAAIEAAMADVAAQ